MSETQSKNPARIISEIEYEYGLKPGTLAGRQRTPHVSNARKKAILALRTVPLAFAEIGRLLRRDRATIMGLVEKPVEKAGTTRGRAVGKSGKTKSSIK